MEAALGRRALGRRWQTLRLFLGCCAERASNCLQRLEGLARLRINTKTSSLFHLGCPYLVLVYSGVVHRLCSTVLLQSAAAILATGMYVIL